MLDESPRRVAVIASECSQSAIGVGRVSMAHFAVVRIAADFRVVWVVMEVRYLPEGAYFTLGRRYAKEKNDKSESEHRDAVSTQYGQVPT